MHNAPAADMAGCGRGTATHNLCRVRQRSCDKLLPRGREFCTAILLTKTGAGM